MSAPAVMHSWAARSCMTASGPVPRQARLWPAYLASRSVRPEVMWASSASSARRGPRAHRPSPHPPRPAPRRHPARPDRSQPGHLLRPPAAGTAAPPAADHYRTRQHPPSRPGTRHLASHPLRIGHPARTRLRRPAHQPQPPPRRHRNPDTSRPAATPASPRLPRTDSPRARCHSTRNHPKEMTASPHRKAVTASVKWRVIGG